MISPLLAILFSIAPTALAKITEISIIKTSLREIKRVYHSDITQASKDNIKSRLLQRENVPTDADCKEVIKKCFKDNAHFFNLMKAD